MGRPRKDKVGAVWNYKIKFYEADTQYGNNVLKMARDYAWLSQQLADLVVMCNQINDSPNEKERMLWIQAYNERVRNISDDFPPFDFKNLYI